MRPIWSCDDCGGMRGLGRVYWGILSRRTVWEVKERGGLKRKEFSDGCSWDCWGCFGEDWFSDCCWGRTCTEGCCEVAFGGDWVWISFSFSMAWLGCVQNFFAFVSPQCLHLLRFVVVSISSGCSPSVFFFLAFFLSFLLGDGAGCGAG